MQYGSMARPQVRIRHCLIEAGDHVRIRDKRELKQLDEINGLNNIQLDF